MRISTRKLLALMIAIIMLVPIIAVSLTASAADAKTFTLDATKDLTDMAAGVKKDGESEKLGTDNYFTLYYAAKTKIDGSNKSFEDGYSGTRRINMQAKTSISSDGVIAAIGFTATSTSTVKLYWACGGDARKVAIYDTNGTVLFSDGASSVKNSPYLSEFTVEAGSYYIGNPDGSNYFFRVDVTEAGYADTSTTADWATVAAPSVTSAADIGGEISITANGQVGKINNVVYADEIIVDVKGGDTYGEYSTSSVADGSVYNCSVSPKSSGTYKVTATLVREGEEPKVSAEFTVDYILPLEAPYLSSATSKGSGTVELEYTSVPEAEKYLIYCGSDLIGESTALNYMVSGLTVGAEYSFKVVAVRGDENKASNTLSVIATEDAKPTWAFTYYGPSTSEADNSYYGNLNEDGYVTVWSENGKGKIQPASVDGLAFYYTKVPTNMNFTLRAKVEVLSWSYSNGQEGFGLLATDRLGKAGDKSNIWNNQYMAGTTKIEYKYDSDEEGNEYVYDVSSTLGSKYTMKLGLGSISKTGVTHENLPKLEIGDTDTVTKEFLSVVSPLEISAARTMGAGTYNLVGKCDSDAVAETNLATLLTVFDLEIQRNNTGYFIRYYDAEGNLVREIKNYDPEALDVLDSEFVYAGFFASRNARAKFYDVSLTTIAPEDDLPAESRPITYITPTLTLTSPSTTTSADYTFAINTNVDGIVKIKDIRGNVIIDSTPVKRLERLALKVTLPAYGEHEYIVEFDPDDDQDLGEYTELDNKGKISEGVRIMYTPGNYHRKSIYVSTSGKYYGTGSKEDPFDIVTAVGNAVPGQTIILMEGTYKFDYKAFRIERGINGTEENPIRMIADPEAATRPVLDFCGTGTGFTHGGDWWIFEGFDVTGTVNGQKGFQVSGNHNTLIDIHAYRNGNTGIQISRYSGTDYTIKDWPSYNLVLNCDSYYNMDAGHEDADGFAAKLTVGPGNVFDGCVAYNNADDGWDLYAKVQTGAIGAVEIRNCVAYKNGYLEDGTASKGNGNGFKMGGESISGHHIIRNSIAFDNRMKGIDSNSCPDIEAYNCISFNNGGSNVAFYTNNAQNTAFKADGIISLRTTGLEIAENLKPKGTQVEADYLKTTNFYWNASVNAAVNSAGDQLKAADIFVSLTFDYEAGVGRNADGTINLGDFLKIKDGTVPAGVGTTGESTASPEINLVPDLAHNYSDKWYNLDDNAHWKECECGDKHNIGEHDLVYIVDKEPTETEAGSRHRECTVCGYRLPSVEIQPTGPKPVDPSDCEEHKDENSDGKCDLCGAAVEPAEEPTGFAAILQMIKDFFAQIVEWFKNLFAGFGGKE